MIRIDAAWIAVEPLDMRAGVDTALGRVVSGFGAARSHHAYLFLNRRANAQGFLNGWSGKLVCDDYSGYKPLFGRDVIEVGCLAHARRKFHVARKSSQSDRCRCAGLPRCSL
jgi:hypothetical protein